jgi:uracil-DNA glycosylase family 4
MSDSHRTLARIQERVVKCRACPRLVDYLDGLREGHPDWWCRPVPLFGDPEARVLLLGLAPGRAGSNRTGRMFTGDASARFLFRALHDVGLASRPEAVADGDGLTLRGVVITAVVRCAPPKNRPTLEEIRRCSPYAADEIRALPNLRTIVALGRIAHDGWLRICGERLTSRRFVHGAVHPGTGGYTLVDAYHPSRQNTNTGRLTMEMFLEVLRKAIRLSG